VPAIVVSYLYGYYAAWIYFLAFGLGMMFQAEITLWDFAKIIWDDFKREIRYLNCRIRRHKLIHSHFTSDMIIFQESEYAHCPKCKAFIRTKTNPKQPTRAFVFEGIDCLYCKRKHPMTAICKALVDHIKVEVNKREQL